MIPPELLRGKKVTSVTSITLANNTAKTVDKAPGIGKKWLLLGFKFTNPDDVARDVNVIKYKEAAKTNQIKVLFSESGIAASAYRQWPEAASNNLIQKRPPWPEILNEAETLEFAWAAGGASAGGTDADGLVVEYIEVDALE